MDWLTNILSQPITQYAGPIGLLIALHKMGVIDVKKWAQNLLVFIAENAGKEEVAEHRNNDQVLLSSMELLRQHYNHETTPLLETLTKGVQEMRGTQLQQCTKLDLIVDSLQDIQRNGIRIRK